MRIRQVQRVLSLATSLTASLGTWLAVAPAVVEGQQKVDMRRATSPDVSVRMMGAFGSLKVIGWAKDSIVITGVLPQGARMDGGFGGDPSSVSRGAKFYVELPNDAPTNGGSLEMRVPLRARVWVKAGSATVDVSGVAGGVDVNIIGGSVRVASNPGELNIESMDGAVVVEGSPTWMRVKTATGDITVRGSSEDAAFTTVSGVVKVSDGRYERARVETVTGSVVFAADLARAGSLSVDSHSGPIELHVGARPGVAVDATTVTGRIENSVSARRPVPGREGRGEELGLEMGTGNARVTLRSFKGNIRLAFR